MMQVRLLKPHEHAGVLMRPGELLVTNERTAQWLVEQGVGEELPFGATGPRPAAKQKRIERKCCGW